MIADSLADRPKDHVSMRYQRPCAVIPLSESESFELLLILRIVRSPGGVA
jgi:hypothetical protein